MRRIRLRRANALAPLTVPLPNQLRITRERFRRGQLRRIKIPPVTALAAKRRDATLSRNTRSGNNENTHAKNARCNGACVNSRKPSESGADSTVQYTAGKKIAFLWGRLYESAHAQTNHPRSGYAVYFVPLRFQRY